MINKNDIMLINDIIYKIHTIEDLDTMRQSVLTTLKLLIPYEIATFTLAEPDSDSPYELISPVYIGIHPEQWESYANEFADMDYTRWTFAAPIAKAYRETDLMIDETRINTPYYQKMFVSGNIHYSAILTIIHDSKFYGCINLFRKKDDIDFTDIEMLMLDILKDHVSYRLAKAYKINTLTDRNYPDKDKLTDIYRLTPREIEILFLLLDNIDRDEICNRLSISQNTLKKHTANIYRKVAVNSHRELIRLMESLA